MYKLIKSYTFGKQDAEIKLVLREDGACIPFDPDNTDYQAYLQWLSEGNTPLPAGEE
jgi:hypothetical protein